MRAKIINLGKRCNNNCFFCFNRGKEFEEDFKKLSGEISKGRRQGCEQIIFSGQEPTLYGKLEELVILARNAGYKAIQIVSNARMFFYKDFAERIIDAGMTELLAPLHSHQERTHDRTTGVSGSFAQAVGGLLNVRELSESRFPYKGVSVSLGTVVTRENVEELASIVRFCQKLKIKQLFFIKENFLKEEIAAPVFLKHLKEASEAARKAGLRLFTSGYGREELGKLAEIRYEDRIAGGKVIKPL